ATVAAASACRAADSMRRTGASMTQTAATTAQLAAMAARVVIPPLLMMCRAATVAPEVIVVVIGVDGATVTDATPSAARAVIVTARRVILTGRPTQSGGAAGISVGVTRSGDVRAADQPRKRRSPGDPPRGQASAAGPSPA